MKSKSFLAVVLMAVVLVVSLTATGLTGCSPEGAVAADLQPVSVNVNSQQGIWVNGQGTVTITPDIATLNLGVSAQASTVAEAQSQASTAMDKVIAALTSNGVNKKDIKTQYFSIQPNYRWEDRTGQNTITGYSVSNVVTVKIRDIEKTGTVIDGVAAAGGNNTIINGISFSVEKPELFYAQARQLAMEDARAKAAELAKLANVALGKASYISENTSSYIPYPVAYAKDMMASGSSPTSISPGETDIIINVQVVFAIE
jgi:uncharacterized protein